MARSASCQQLQSAMFGIQGMAKDSDGFLRCLPANNAKKTTVDGNIAAVNANGNAVLRPSVFNAEAQQPLMESSSEEAEAAEGNEEDSFGSMGDQWVDYDGDTGVYGDDSPCLVMWQQQNDYCQKSLNRRPFGKRMKDCINLMYALRASKASLDTYDSVMEWHLKANGDLHPWETLSGSNSYLSRQSVFKELRIRYGMDQYWNRTSKIVLPSSKASVNIVWTDARECIRSLLTDPRIEAEDYIFRDGNPFAPPQNANTIGDLHTGRAYSATYRELIERPDEQILLPVILYIDGASTSQFSDHEITAVKMSLGIYTRKARDRPWMWRVLGYVPPISKQKSRGKRLFIDSKHLDAIRVVHEAQENEGNLEGPYIHPAQDFHAMLDKVLESFVKLQNKGFVWDLSYNGNVYKNTEFVPFVPFIKCDTKEANILCGSYTNQGKNVAQLCRYCKCPTMESDDFKANYPMKTKPHIEGLVRQGKLDELKSLSQQPIHNACYKLHFGSHSTQGVHGATPLEMLHALLLGLFRYARETFFVRLGDSSKLAEDFDGLCRLVGKLLSRQSIRDKPKTMFSNGIRAGKLMGKEYRGVLLVMLVAMNTETGRQILGKKAREFGATFHHDWVTLLETLLQWERWMSSDVLQKRHVRAARAKHRFIMYLFRKVAMRKAGMGLKIPKFHMVLHIVEDILNFGVPMEVDTGSNESGHKGTIAAAKLTQRQRQTFEVQTARRLDEMHLLELARQELGGRPLWDYGIGYAPRPKSPEVDAENTTSLTGGASFRVYLDSTGDVQIDSIRRDRKKGPKFMMEDALLWWFNGLQNALAKHYKEVALKTFHSRNGQIFRANACYRGTVWRDWMYIDWGRDGKFPCKCWGFIDLSDLPVPVERINYGGLRDITPGVYAIVESAEVVENTHELVYRIETECLTNNNGEVQNLKYYLADVEAIIAPAMVVPDVGGPENSYLAVVSPDEWAGTFEEWLEEDINLDDLTDVSGDEESDESLDGSET